MAGDEIDDAIIQYARRDHNLVIGERTAENAKIAAGSAYPLEEEVRVTLRGRDLLTGLPKAVEVCSVELRDAISAPVEHDRRTGQDRDRGDAAGAGRRHHGAGDHPGRRRGAAARTRPPVASTSCKMPVRRAEDPLTCVARGTGRVAEALHLYQRALAGGQELRRRR